MAQKSCFKCKQVKCLSEFYKHSEMKDGHLNKCKDCTKVDVLSHRNNNLEKIREYDRARGSRRTSEETKAYRNKYPKKCKAHYAVKRAIKSKKLFREKCTECGRTDNTHAHHDDYDKPLNIRWLCPPCHFAWHTKNGHGANAI